MFVQKSFEVFGNIHASLNYDLYHQRFNLYERKTPTIFRAFSSYSKRSVIHQKKMIVAKIRGIVPKQQHAQHKIFFSEKKDLAEKMFSL